MTTIGLYAGSFDPITNGHVWMIQQGAALFGTLVVLVGVNPAKRYTFTENERLEMMVPVLDAFAPSATLGPPIGNAFLVDVAQKMGATHLLRGVRSAADFEYERSMRNVNADRAPGVTTVLLTPPRDLCEVSSSMVKGLVGPEGWEDLVAKYVPAGVLEKLKELRE